MSNWTHVIASVRLDSWRGVGGCLKEGIKDTDYTLEDFFKVFGKECSFYSPNAIWDDVDKNPNDYLPMGSEGSLELSYWVNPQKCDCFSYVVTIFGDLRDHDSADEIIEWFKNKTNEIENDERNNLSIRQAVITAYNERNGSKTWHWDYGSEE